MSGWSGMGGKGFREEPSPGDEGLSPELVALVVVVAFFLGLVAFGGN